MARRHSQPFFEFNFCSDGLLNVKASSEFGGFVANLNLKAIKDAIRQRTNRAVKLVAEAAKKVGRLFLPNLGKFLGRCLAKAIETIATCILIVTIVALAVPTLKWFISTPLASQIGITLTAEQIILIVDKIVDLVL